MSVEIEDRHYEVSIYESGNGSVDLDINGLRVGYDVDSRLDDWFVHGPEGDFEFTELPRFPIKGLDDAASGLKAPMPGSVLVVNVKAGDTVEQGKVLLILEAMKMEHQITAPRDGTIEEMKVAVGDQVANGELLVVLESDEEEGE